MAGDRFQQRRGEGLLSQRIIKTSHLIFTSRFAPVHLQAADDGLRHRTLHPLTSWIGGESQRQDEGPGFTLHVLDLNQDDDGRRLGAGDRQSFDDPRDLACPPCSVNHCCPRR